MRTRRTPVIVLLSLLILCLAFAGCQKDPGTVEAGAAGTYYCDVDGAEYTVVLGEDGAVALTFGGEPVNGTYTYDGAGKVVLTLEGRSEALEATLVDSELKLTYNGTEYTLLIKTVYTVKYQTNGAAAIADSQVVNGRVLARPENPTKDGFVFIGWYTDAEFKTAYDFDAPVTANLTLYARFAEGEAAGTEYTVKFDAGYLEAPAIADATTVGGVLYNLPTPTRSGYSFVGWWMSDYATAEKPTCQYKDQALTGDTTLYAVWQKDGDGPVVSVKGDTITWTYANAKPTTSYTVKIIAPNGAPLKTESVNATSFKFDFADTQYPCGDYTISVTAENKTGSAYLKNRPLAVVSEFAVNGTTLSFKEVANADYYELVITCGNQYHNHATNAIRLEKGAATYDFAECDMLAGGMKFTVKACSANYIPSTSEAWSFEQNLAEVSGLQNNVAQGTVTWNAVTGATGYTVVIKNNNAVVETLTVTETFVSIKSYTGNINVSVVPNAKMYNSPKAVDLTVVSTKLPTPQNIQVNGYTVTWDAVAGAAKYLVSVDGETKEVTDATITLDATLLPEGKSEYNLTVQAIAATAANNSVASDIVKIANGMQGNPVYQANKLTWNSVIGAKGYMVTLNGAEPIIVRNAYAYVSLNQAGSNEFKVCAFFDDAMEDCTEWKSVTVTAYTVTFHAGGGYTNDDAQVETLNVYLAQGDSAPFPSVANPGYNIEGWFARENCEGEEYKQEYKLTVGQDVTVYAGWAAKTYKVTVMVPVVDGKLTGGITANGYTKMEISILYGQMYTLPVPTNHDAILAFMGWYTEGDMAYTSFDGSSTKEWVDRNDTVVLVPKWAPIFKFIEREDGTSYAVVKDEGIKTLTKVTVPAVYRGLPITAIDDFSSSSSLITFELPNTIEIITLIRDDEGAEQSGHAFKGCSKLQNIIVYPVDGENDPTFFSEDGILYRYTNDDKTKAELLQVPAAKAGKVTVSNKVAVIPKRAFYSTDITSLVIPASVTTIEDHAFYYCDKMVDITFESVLEGETALPLTIGEGAFRYCKELVSILLPARLENLAYLYYTEVVDGENEPHYNAFYGASKLESIRIEAGCKNYASSDDGILLNVKKDTILYYPEGKPVNYEKDGVLYDGTYRIPEGITTIGESAFYSNDFMTSLIIPGYVINIDKLAFRSCTKIESLIFEGDRNDQDLTIGEQAFYQLNVLESVELPENLKTMGAWAFGSCSKLVNVTLNSYVSQAEHDAYEEKRQNGTLTDADQLYNFAAEAFGTKPSSEATTTSNFYVKTLHFGEFVDAFDIGGVFGNKVESITTDPNNKYIRPTEKGIIYNATVTELIYYPLNLEGPYVTPDTLEIIGTAVFNDKDGLTEITIGKNVTKIGDNAFALCGGLTKVTFEQGGTQELVIGEQAFRSCVALTEIAIPERTVSIGNEAFKYCSKLVSVSLPASLEKLGTYEEIADVNIPDGNGGYKNGTVEVVKDVIRSTSTALNTMGVFGMCTELANISVAPGSKYYASVDGALYGSEYLEEREVKDDKGNTNTELYFHPADGSARVLYTSPQKSVGNAGTLTLPETVTMIWTHAFYYGDYSVTEGEKRVEHIKSVTVNNGVAGNKVEIGYQVFYYALYLKTIDLPDGVSNISEDMFYNCKALTAIAIPYTVATVEPDAFYNCVALESITFDPTPAGVEPIPFEAVDGEVKSDYYGNTSSTGVFSGAKALKELILPDRMTRIPNAMVAYCAALEKVYIPASVTEIGTYAFTKCEALADLTIGEGSKLVEIGQSAFSYTAFPKFEFPETVEIIGQSAFANSKLTEVSLPASFKYEVFKTATTGNPDDEYVNGHGAFGYCKELETVYIPKGVKKIASTMFISCPKLHTVTFEEGSELENIGSQAFSGDTALTNFDIPDGVTWIGLLAFDRTSLTDITLPDGLKTIKNSAFKEIKTLKSIVIPASVEKIWMYAFQNCTALESVVFETDPEKLQLTEIGNQAFENTALKTFTFPKNTEQVTITDENGVETTETKINEIVLGEKLFAKCRDLKTVFISESIKNLTNVFVGCVSVETFNLVEDHPNMIKDDKFPFIISTDRKTIQMVLGELTTQNLVKDENGLWTLIIPEGYEYISDSVFAGQSAIEKVVIPSTMKEIGIKAFSKCINLKAIEFAVDEEKALSLELIDKQAFEYTAIEALEIGGPNIAKTIGQQAFQYCTELKSVKLTNVKELGSTVFTYCGALETIDLGNALTKFGSSVFSNCVSLKKVVIPNTVTTYGSSLFSKCASLTTVTLSNKANTMTSSMFSGCSSLESIVIPGNVTTYGSSMFLDCTSLKEITLSSKAKTITSSMFKNCESLVTIVIPDAVTTYGSNMFEGCTSLKNVTLSTAAVKMVNSMFKNCTALEFLKIPDNVTTYGGGSTSNGMFVGCTALKEVDLSPKAVKIVNYMFDGCTALEKVIIPGNVTTYGTYMFRNCSSLKEVTLSGAAKKLTNYMFQNCTSLKTIVIPDDVTDYANYVFSGCSSLKDVTLSSKAAYLPTQMFANCTALETLKLPTSVTRIGANTFLECAALKEINLDKVQYIGASSATATTVSNAYSFKYCTALTTIDLSSLIKCGSGAFQNCDELTTVTFGDKVETYGTYMFQYCHKLNNVTLCPTAPIADSMFNNCTGLSTVVIPDGVETIGSAAFFYTNLTTVTVPASVTKIGNEAFTTKVMKNIVVSDGNTNFKSLANGALYDTANDKLICWPAAGEAMTMENVLNALDKSFVTSNGEVKLGGYDAFRFCTLTGVVDLSKTGMVEIPSYFFYGVSGDATLILPDTLKKIGNSAFYGCTAFKKIVLPDGITEIGNNAFYNCTTLTELNMPTSLKTIGNNAFDGCTGLKKIILPESVVEVSNYAFSRMDLDELYIPAGIKILKSSAISESKIGKVTIAGADPTTKLNATTGLGTYIFDKSEIGVVELGAGFTAFLPNYTFRDAIIGEVILKGTEFRTPTGSDISSYSSAPFLRTTVGKVTLEEGLLVLNQYMFYQANVGSITIPSTVTELGKYAFYKSTVTNLTFAVNAEGKTALTTIGQQAFDETTGLATLEIPATVTTIGDYVFRNMADLTKIVLPEGLVEIPQGALYGCEKLTDVNIPSTVKEIAGSAFMNCIALETIVLPENMDTFGNTVFKGCTALKNVTMPKTLTTMGTETFMDCSAIVEITVPSGIEKQILPTRTFSGCTALKIVNLPDDLIELGMESFEFCTSLESFIIPESVTKINTGVFNGCTAIKEIYIPDTVDTIFNYVFEGWTKEQTVKFGGSLLTFSNTTYNFFLRSEAVYLFNCEQ